MYVAETHDFGTIGELGYVKHRSVFQMCNLDISRTLYPNSSGGRKRPPRRHRAVLLDLSDLDVSGHMSPLGISSQVLHSRTDTRRTVRMSPEKRERYHPE